MKRRVLNIVVGLYLALIFINTAITAYYTMSSLNTTSLERASDPGWKVEFLRDRAILHSIKGGGPADGVLRAGDEIVAINGKRMYNGFEASMMIQRMPSGSSYEITIRRDGILHNYTLITDSIPPLGLVLVILRPLLTLVIPAILLFSSLALFLFKSDDKLAMLLSLVFSSFVGMTNFGIYHVQLKWLAVILAVSCSISMIFYPLFFHFFLLFPDPRGSLSPLLKRFQKFEWYQYIPYLLYILPFFIVTYISLIIVPERLKDWQSSYPWTDNVLEGITISYIVGGLVSLLVNYQKANRPLRRKMRVVVAGSLAGTMPLLLVIASVLLYPWYPVSRLFVIWLFTLSLILFPLFPLSFLYAIVRHQVIPVRIIIRRSLRYLFVRQGSILLELSVVGVVITLLLKYVFAPMQIGLLAGGVISGAVAIAAWQITQWLHHKIIAPAIDRAFFRRTYNAQMILSELSQALRVMSDWREETLVFVSMKIQEALQTENVTIFLRDEKSGDYNCAVATHYSDHGQIAVATFPDLKLQRGSLMMQRLAESSRPLPIDLDDHDPNTLALALQESDTSVQIRSSLILPVATKDQLVGVVSLGPRLGDLPFSREDRELLRAVAAQLSFAIENAQLVRLKAEEERMRRELEFASEVQRRLFPQHPPQLSQIELCGVCHPARDVGGDYYDFLELGDGQLGIAVADVSGKGISAALLMSVIQASLRAQAPKAANGQMTELIASMNRLLCESTGANNYATFFYALLDWKARRLTYVNAGHNPPILIRAGARASAVSAVNGVISENGSVSSLLSLSENHVSLLTTGGPVIGLLENCAYENCVIDLSSGDVLVAYTDGLSEARNPEGEEFGEERLTQLVSAISGLSADEMRERIIENVRDWQQDAPQHDDMTMVIVKVK
jgi:phosphoserine phosphatase RsbU/P